METKSNQRVDKKPLNQKTKYLLFAIRIQSMDEIKKIEESKIPDR